MYEIENFVDEDTKRFGWIQNTEPSDSMGRHWVAFFIDIPEMEINYYDSLVENGGEPSEESLMGLKDIIDKINPEYYLLIKFNRVREQNPSSKNCGYLALKFILDRYAYKDFKESSGYGKIENDYIDGERNIEKFKKYL